MRIEIFEEFVNDLKEIYNPIISKLDSKIKKEDREEFIEDWGYLLNQLGIPSSDTAKVTVLASFLPLIEDMKDLTGDQFKDLFTIHFLSFIAAVESTTKE